MKIYTSPKEYIDAQPIERQFALKNLMNIISNNLPEAFEQNMQYNMISFVIPKNIYPAGYHCRPELSVSFISIANQKNYISLYHMGVVADKNLLNFFTEKYNALNIGKLDMGKSCIRFKNINKIPYDLIGELCTKMSPYDYLQLYEKYSNNK